VAHLPQGSNQAEEILLTLALHQDAAAVKTAVAGIKQTLDPIGTEKEHQSKRARSACYLSPMLDGMWDLAGTLDSESGAMLATALDALATGYLHPIEAATPYSTNAQESPTHTSIPPAPATSAPAAPAATGTPTATATSLPHQPHPPATPTPSPTTPEHLTGPQRRALALTDLAARALTAGEVGIHGGIRPHLSVLIPENVLHPHHTPPPAHNPHQTAPTHPQNPATATTAYGHPLPPSTAHRLACDCALTPIRIDDKGLPLNVGRTQRLATTAQRKALAVRDKGCTHPGCHIGPQWCDAHHLISWLDGGPTDLDNLVLLCRRHHSDIHYQQRLATLTSQPPTLTSATSTSTPTATEPTSPLALAC
jgi:Domain of unknown function (DUF222)/HNH endonuclease